MYNYTYRLINNSTKAIFTTIQKKVCTLKKMIRQYLPKKLVWMHTKNNSIVSQFIKRVKRYDGNHNVCNFNLC